MTYAEIYNRNRIKWLYEIARSDVSAKAVKVGLLFATFLQPEDREEVRPGYAWIMRNARVSRGTLARCIKELEEKGYLHVHRIDSYRSWYAMPFEGETEWMPTPKASTEKTCSSKFEPTTKSYGLYLTSEDR